MRRRKPRDPWIYRAQLEAERERLLRTMLNEIRRNARPIDLGPDPVLPAWPLIKGPVRLGYRK